jgi:hypothetical protein
MNHPRAAFGAFVRMGCLTPGPLHPVENGGIRQEITMSKRACGFALLLGGLVSSCESSSSSSASIAFDELAPKYASAACSAYTNCFGPLVSLLFNGADCTDLTTKRLDNGTYSLIAQKITEGKIVYDGTKAQACLDSIASLGCDGLLQRDQPTCLAALDGKVELGGACDLNEECQGSAICKSSDGTCPGQCSELLAAGQRCSQDADCDGGLQCSPETQLCVKPAAANAACEYGSPPCGPGLICLGKDDTNKVSGVCYNAITALSADVGAACDPNAGTLCKSGLSCVADSYDVVSAKLAWLCVQAGSYAAGQSCKPGFPDACARGYYCLTGTGAAALSGTCTAIPDAKGACGTGIGAQCKSGAVCVSGICQNFAVNGVSCTGDAMCYSQYCGTSSGCEPRTPCK